MKRRLLTVLLVLVCCVIGVGFVRGWFALSSPGDAQSNKFNLNLAVDPDKVKQDASQVKEKTEELTGQTTQ